MYLAGHEIGAYRILSLLGRGGTAEVYKAYHPALKREVALKMLLLEVSKDEDWVRRFRQEAELLGRLDHPHILPIYDAGEHEGRPFLVMKYMEDTVTLRSQLRGEPWPVNRVVKVVSQVGGALDAAHKAGVVHRDIKPSNILVTPDLRCCVFDFGIAKPVRRGEIITTGADHIVGTPEFMSPEQCKGERIDHRSDIYSLGVVTYQMLAGRVPFSAETAIGILMKHLTEPLPIPPKGVALPPAVNGVLRQAMAREPQDRFATAGEFSDALQRAAEERATVTLHASEIRQASIPTLRVPAWLRRMRAMRTRGVRLGVSAVTLAGMLALVYALWPPAELERSLTAPVEKAKTAGAETVRGGPEPEAPAQAEREPAPSPSAKRTREPRRELATLEIDTRLAATVHLDGKPIGTAPGVFPSIAPGSHTIALVAAGGFREEKNLLLTAGSIHRIQFDFPETAAAASVASNPAQSLEPPGVFREASHLDVPEVRWWTGFLTDGNCGRKGGAEGSLHLRCAERCIREGEKPMLYARGRLFGIDGFERISLHHDQPLRFRAWLEGNILHVVDPADVP